MKKYLVTLTLFIGSYEKTAHHVVEAKDEDEAWVEALKGESHHTPVMDADNGGCWDGDEFRYTVYNSRELTEHDYNTLKQLRMAW